MKKGRFSEEKMVQILREADRLNSPGDLLIAKLHYPLCSQEDIFAIAELVTTCPVELRQQLLDEIEGATSKTTEVTRIGNRHSHFEAIKHRPVGIGRRRS